MKSPLSILHLEDDPLDTELVIGQFRKAGLEVELERVDTLDDFQRALACDRHALVLSDFAMPKLDPMEALSQVRQTCPELPFIFLSGTLGEEQAIETLKKGATDYVLKQRLDRLVPAVQRALHEAEQQARRKQAEEALRASEEKFRVFFEQAVVGMGRVNFHDARWIDVNDAFCQMLGYTREFMWPRRGRSSLTPMISISI